MAVARPRLLILRALGIGDVLTAVPALRGLAQAFPGHERLIAAPAALRALIDLVETEGGGPAVHGILDARGLHSLPARARHPDVAVNLHGRGPQSHRLLLEQRPGETLWFASAAVAASRGSPRWRPSEHEVMRWCRMLAESGVPCRPDRLELRAPAGPPPAGSRGATLLHPGAASPARRWPAARFAEVARAEASRGRRVMITGSRGDLPSAHRIAARAGLPDRSVLAGRTTLADLARAIAAAGRVVCGDTGVAHLATAFGTPSVVLFGPVSPAEWGPPHDRLQHRALWVGRRGDPHGARPDPGLLEISAGDVIEALEELPV